MITIGNKILTLNNSFLGYPVQSAEDPDASAYFARMALQPPDGLRILLNQVFVDLKAQGIWDELDAFWFMCLHTDQASTLNIKGDYFNQTWATISNEKL